LKVLDGSSYQSHPELLMGLKDSQGDDVGQHYLCVLEMAKASCIFFNHLETFVSSDAADHARRVCAALRNAAVKLYSGLAKFQASVAGDAPVRVMGGDDFARLCRNQQRVKEYGKLTALALSWQFDELSKVLVELITCMTAQGISGPKLELQMDEPKPKTREAGREACFQSGWKDFSTYTSHKLGIGIMEGEAINGASAGTAFHVRHPDSARRRTRHVLMHMSPCTHACSCARCSNKASPRTLPRSLGC